MGLKAALKSAEKQIKKLESEKKKKDQIFTEILMKKDKVQQRLTIKPQKSPTKVNSFTSSYVFNPPLPTAPHDLKQLKALQEQVTLLNKQLDHYKRLANNANINDSSITPD